MLTSHTTETNAAKPQKCGELVDILIGVTVNKLPELSQTALKPTYVKGDAVAAFVKSKSSAVRMGADTLLLHADIGDGIRWQMTSVCDRFEYEVSIYDIRVQGNTAMTKPKPAKISDAVARVSGIGWIEPLNYFRNYVLALDAEPAMCEVCFKVTRKTDNALIGYGAWLPQLLVRGTECFH